MTTLSDYYKLLDAHDWHYSQSEDQAVYRAGRADQRALQKISAESTDHLTLFTEFSDHKRLGTPKPQVPMTKTFRTGEQDVQVPSTESSQNQESSSNIPGNHKTQQDKRDPPYSQRGWKPD